MTKKRVIVLILAALVAGAGFAQSNWYDSYAPGVDANKIFINAGIGLGFYSGYSIGIPPLSVSADFKLPVDLPITVGGIVGFNTWKYDPILLYKVDVTYTNIAFGVRGAYHFNFLDNLDAYACLTLGYIIQTAKAKYASDYDNSPVPKPAYADKSIPLVGINIGGRYFFTKNIGAYLELGYSRLQAINAGVTVKL